MQPEVKFVSQRLIGFILGDGTVTKHKNGTNSRISLVHSVHQKEYLEHKIKLLKDLGIEMTLPSIHKTTLSNGITYDCLYSNSKYLPIFTKLRDKLYPKGRKTIRATILENLNEQDLALWFLDAGSIQRGSSSGVGKANGLRLATDCFDRQEHEIIIKYLRKNFGINAVLNYKTGNPYIYLNVIDSIIFVHKCREYLLQVPQLAYKWQSFDIIGAITGVPDNSESLSDREKATRLFIRYLVFNESENNPDNEVLKYYESFETFKQAIKTSRTRLGVKDMTRIQKYLEEQCTYVCRSKTPWIPWNKDKLQTDNFATSTQGPSSIKIVGGSDPDKQVTPGEISDYYNF